LSQTTKQRLLEYAAQRLGRDVLAARLKVDEPTVQKWIEGQGEMPNRTLLALADLIDEIDGGRKK
jgi:DNA-binding transcriptional regulator YiaG